MYTQQEQAQIRHIIEMYTKMDHAEREKYIIFGDGITAASTLKSKEG